MILTMRCRPRTWILSLGLVFSLVLSACDRGGEDASIHEASIAASPKGDELIPLGLSGIDHLPDHVSVQDFWVNGVAGQQAGMGGSTVCCVSVPRRWRPGMKVRVRWLVLNWRDWRDDIYEADAEIDPYTEDHFGQFFVHFLPDGSVRAAVSMEGPESPDYPGPRMHIPRKYPWKVYGAQKGAGACTDHSLLPPGPCKDN